MPHRFFVYCIFFLLVCAGTSYGQGKKALDTTVKEQQLKEIVISGKKNAIETAPGKTIVNVQEQAGNAGKTVLDVLRKVPGVSVDGRGNISVTGKQGVMVMINGRPTYLGGDDLRDYLQGMTAEEVSQIELVTQPSAQYDAEGNAGIINIKTRKIRKKGFNGNVTLTGTKSLLEATHNTLLLNYRKNKVNWYTSLNNVTGRNTVFWQQDMKFKDSVGNVVATSLMKSAPVERFDKYNIRTGADCNYSEHTFMGFSLTGAYYANQMHSPISIKTGVLNGASKTSIRNTYEHSLRKNASANAYLKHTFGRQSEVSVNLDYLLNTKRLYQSLDTDTDSGGITLPNQLTLRSRVPINISVYSATANHNTTFANGLKIETGAKHGYVTVDNAAYFTQYQDGHWGYDSSRTNRFLYTEHISALYVNGIKKINEHWEMQLGLRGELANLYGLQEATGERLARHLPALFPTAYVSYKPDSSNTLEMNYGRRIQRPHYGQLNPFNYYTFYSAYQRGNASLLPQYTHNIELKHNYKNHLTTTLQLSRVNNTVTYVSMIEPASPVAYGMPVNFGSNKMVRLDLTYNGRPRPWWELMASISGMRAVYAGLLNNIAIQNDGTGYTLWVNNGFTFGKWGADCYASYNSPMLGSPVSTSVAGFYSNAGVSRKVLQDKGTVKLSIDDPFYLYRGGNEEVQPYFYSNAQLRTNSRYVTLVITYNFGKKSGKSVERNEKMPEEAKRL